MSTLIVILILVLVGGVFAASFAADRRRSQAAWFVIGGLTGPAGILVLLLLPPLPESTPVKKGRGTVLAVIVVFAVFVIATLGVFEAVGQYQKSLLYTELQSWELYGDALIRMGQAIDNPPEAFVVKAARNQVSEYERELRDGMRRTESDLLLAVRGLHEVKGATGILANVYRLATFRRPLWPAPISLSTEDQDELIHFLEAQLRKYRNYLDTIDAAQDVWAPAPSDSATEAED